MPCAHSFISSFAALTSFTICISMKMRNMTYLGWDFEEILLSYKTMARSKMSFFLLEHPIKAEMFPNLYQIHVLFC